MLLSKLLQTIDIRLQNTVAYTSDQKEYRYLLIKKEIPVVSSFPPQIDSLYGDNNTIEIILSISLDTQNRIVYNNQAKLYCFEPTEIYTGMGFNIHAPFLLNAAKEIEICAWNQYLFDEIIMLITGNLIYRLKSYDIRELYQILYFEERTGNGLRQLYDHLIEALQTTDFLYCPTLQKYFKPADLIIGDENDTQILGDTLYNDQKLLLSFSSDESEYSSWLRYYFNVKVLEEKDILCHIETIVAGIQSLHRHKLVQIYDYLLKKITIETNKLPDLIMFTIRYTN